MEAVLEHVHIDIYGNVIVDLTKASAIRVRGLDKNNEWKEYLLRVSESGKLSLV